MAQSDWNSWDAQGGTGYRLAYFVMLGFLSPGHSAMSVARKSWPHATPLARTHLSSRFCALRFVQAMTFRKMNFFKCLECQVLSLQPAHLQCQKLWAFVLCSQCNQQALVLMDWTTFQCAVPWTLSQKCSLAALLVNIRWLSVIPDHTILCCQIVCIMYLRHSYVLRYFS